MSFITTFKDVLIEALKEHKKMIIILYTVFIILFIGSWLFVSDSVSSTLQNIQNMTATAPSPVASDLSPLDLFIHNGVGGFIYYLGSIFFAIPAIVQVIYNGLNLGAVGPVLEAVHAGGGLQYIIYLIPHGIFEITGTILQSAAGILLFKFIWVFLKNIAIKDNGKRLSVRQSFEKNKKVLIQSVAIIIFATILMAIAAPIEAYFSVPFSDWIFGL